MNIESIGPVLHVYYWFYPDIQEYLSLKYYILLILDQYISITAYVGTVRFQQKYFTSYKSLTLESVLSIGSFLLIQV